MQTYWVRDDIGKSDDFVLQPEMRKIFAEYLSGHGSLTGDIIRVMILAITGLYLESEIIIAYAFIYRSISGGQRYVTQKI
jgi:hypothetical protein